MQVSVKKLNNLSRQLTIEVPEQQIAEAVNKRLRKVAKTAKISGFRPGKAPIKVIEQHYGEAVLQEAQSDLMRNSYVEAIDSEKLSPAGYPQFTLVSQEKGKTFIFKAEFEVYPEIKLAKFSKLKINKNTAEIVDADVDKTLESICKQNTVWQDVERAAQDTDQVTIDFVGKIDDKVFNGGEAKDFTLILGEGRLIPGFEQAIVGHNVGDKFVADLSFPEEYQQKDVAGKPVVFDIELTAVKQAQLPQVDDALADKLGVKGGAEQLRVEVRENMQRELDYALQNHLKSQVMDALYDAHKIDVPTALIEDEAKNMREHMAKKYGIEASKLPQTIDTEIKQQAERRVALGLIVAEIIKEYDIKPDQQRVDQAIDKIAQVYDEPEQVVAMFKQDKQRLHNIQANVTEDQLVDKVVEEAKVTEQQKTFDEIMQPKQA